MEVEEGDTIIPSLSIMIKKNDNDNSSASKMLLKDVLNSNHISVLNFGSCT